MDNDAIISATYESTVCHFADDTVTNAFQKSIVINTQITCAEFHGIMADTFAIDKPMKISCNVLYYKQEQDPLMGRMYLIKIKNDPKHTIRHLLRFASVTPLICTIDSVFIRT